VDQRTASPLSFLAHWLTCSSRLLAIALTPLLRRVDEATRWTVMEFGLDGARALLATLAGSMLSLLVFVLGALLIALQLSSTQLTPRVVAVAIMRRGPVRSAIALVVFTSCLAACWDGPRTRCSRSPRPSACSRAC
jgi:uncharacterized membrane protein